MSSEETHDQEQNSVTGWIVGLKAGDADAVRRLWDRYATELVEAARKRLGKTPRQAADEEDVAISVFAALCRGAEAGRFRDIRNRDDLWWLLLAMTHRRAVSQIRRETASKRGGWGAQESLDAPGAAYAYSELISDEPTGEYLTILRDQYEHLMSLLRDDNLRRVASLRVEGCSVKEIAAELSLGRRAIERKLELIRATWRDAM